MRITILPGVSQYDNVTLLVRELAQGLREEGHTVDELPTGTSLMACADIPSELYFSFNATNATQRIGKLPWFDAIDVPFVTWLVDHPCQHRSRLAELAQLQHPATGLVLCTIDPTHLGYLERRWGLRCLGGFLPHPACLGAAPRPWAERDGTVIMPGSMPLPAQCMREGFQELPAPLGEIAQALADDLAGDHIAVLHERFQAVLQRDGFWRMLLNTDMEDLVLYMVDAWLRQHRREQLLDLCRDAGITVELYGNIDAGIPAVAAHRRHGPLDFAPMLERMGTATAVLHSGANFPAGSHERPLCAMANGAIAIAERTAWLDAEFRCGDDYLGFRWDTIGDDLAGLRQRLAAPDAAAMAAAGQARCTAGHGRRARAAALLGLTRTALAARGRALPA